MVHPVLQPPMDPEHAKLIRTSSGLKFSVGFFARPSPSPAPYFHPTSAHSSLGEDVWDCPQLRQVRTLPHFRTFSSCAVPFSDSRPPHVLLPLPRISSPPPLQPLYSTNFSSISESHLRALWREMLSIGLSRTSDLGNGEGVNKHTGVFF